MRFAAGPCINKYLSDDGNGGRCIRGPDCESRAANPTNAHTNWQPTSRAARRRRRFLERPILLGGLPCSAWHRRWRIWGGRSPVRRIPSAVPADRPLPRTRRICGAAPPFWCPLCSSRYHSHNNRTRSQQQTTNGDDIAAERHVTPPPKTTTNNRCAHSLKSNARARTHHLRRHVSLARYWLSVLPGEGERQAEEGGEIGRGGGTGNCSDGGALRNHPPAPRTLRAAEISEKPGGFRTRPPSAPPPLAKRRRRPIGWGRRRGTWRKRRRGQGRTGRKNWDFLW